MMTCSGDDLPLNHPLHHMANPETAPLPHNAKFSRFYSFSRPVTIQTPQTKARTHIKRDTCYDGCIATSSMKVLAMTFANWGRSFVYESFSRPGTTAKKSLPKIKELELHRAQVFKALAEAKNADKGRLANLFSQVRSWMSGAASSFCMPISCVGTDLIDSGAYSRSIPSLDFKSNSICT